MNISIPLGEANMGISQSFLAVKGRLPEEIHRVLGLSDTGIAAGEWDYPRPLVRGAALPDGWYLVLLDDVDHRFVMVPDIPTRLSADCEVLVSRVCESATASICAGRKDGARVWQVAHEADESGLPLDVEGTPPPPFDEIAARMRAKQEEEERRDRDGSRLHLGDPGRARQRALPLPS